MLIGDLPMREELTDSRGGGRAEVRNVDYRRLPVAPLNPETPVSARDQGRQLCTSLRLSCRSHP